ncbi:MAG: DUF3556 domain-containing protein [Myxococcales bacterium]|nr:DUF3556 domain-containing protein [Myxococcales bacterium]
MKLLAPTPPPYDPLSWVKRPLGERGRMVCEAWALQGYGTPPAVFGVYLVKILAYVGAWIGFTTLSLGVHVADIGSWWLSPAAFQKAILWSMLFEGMGLGCGSGPLTGRYSPPIGGVLHFLRPGTTKLPVFPSAPVLGGSRRTWLDVALYGAIVALVLRALLAPAIDASHLIPLAVLIPLLGLADKTTFLAFRAEHYWTTIVVFTLTQDFVAGAKAVQLALWFWAGVSKLNHHFPTVICVMTSNGPLWRIPAIRKAMYRSFPDDLRPSRLAVFLAHAGAALEFGTPLVLAFAPGGWSLTLGIALMLALHTYITSNVPMGVPLEWNVMVVYGGFALFWAHPDVTALDVGSLPLAIFLAVMLVGVPLLGNLRPGAVSFLCAMRYYAGNWAYGVWLFRGESFRKLDKLTKAAPWVYDQLARFYDRSTAVGLVGKVLAFRLMHLHGRALPVLIPKAVEKLEDYEYLDGEIVAGMVLGWNFGDGHLHDEQLLKNVQEQCGFAPGELRCIFVEAQPLFGDRMGYRIHDACDGPIESGELTVSEMRERQPWAATAEVRG